MASSLAGEVEVPWYVGLPAYQVSLEAPEGGLPEENLEPLLRVHQGDRLSPADVRQDVALLYRAGAFASVEAFAEPWTDIDAEGNPVPAVRLAYVVRPPVRVAAVEIDGVRGPTRKAVQRAMNLDLGRPFYAERDVETVVQAVRQALASDGWPEADVRLEVSPVSGTEVDLRMTVDVGQPRLLGRVIVTGSRVVGPDEPPNADGAPMVKRADVERWLRRAGLDVGDRIRSAASTDARDAVMERLYASGWMDPRVKLAFVPAGTGDAQETLLVQVETGAHLDITTRGRGLPDDSQLKEVMGFSRGDRLTPGSVDDARGRLEQWFRRNGYPAARVEVGLGTEEVANYLEVNVQRGPRHMLRRVRVRGSEAFSERYVAGAFIEAEPDTLGRRVYSPDAVKAGMATLREFYRGQGFLDATVGIDDAVKVSRVRWLAPRKPHWGRGVTVDVTLSVVEGPRTVLSSLSSVGGIGIEDDILSKRRPELVGSPYRQSDLDKLSQDILDAYRGHGYLQATVDIEVATRLGSASTTPMASAQLQVTPGQQLRLRGIIIQGNQRTRRRVIEREIALQIGEPITPEGIAQTRSRLYDLDLFRLVSPDLIGDDDRSRDLLVRVEERPNLMFEVGGGASTDEGLRVRASATHRNLAGLGQRVTALGQVGYAWESDGWRPDFAAPVWRAALRYEAPDFPSHGETFLVEAVLNEVVQAPTFRLSRMGGTVGLRVTRGKAELQVGYRGQRRRLEDVDGGALVMGDPWRVRVGLDSKDVTGLTLPSAPRWVSGPELQVLVDRRDDRLDPRQGLLVAGQVSIDDTLLGDPFTVHAATRAEQLVPVGPVIFAVSASGGAGWAAGEGATLPVEDRFYLGGGDSLRGFKLDTVGPANFVSRPAIAFPDQIAPVIEGTVLSDDPAHWVPTGGDSMVAGSLELRVPMSAIGFQSDTTWLVGFTDVGHVGFLDPLVRTTSMNPANPALADRFLRTSIGGGVRVSSPVGPASLVIGIDTNPIPIREEDWYLVHFSLGAL